VLNCTVLNCAVLNCAVLNCAVLHCTVMRYAMVGPARWYVNLAVRPLNRAMAPILSRSASADW
jgi:hypothetical protein